MKFLRGWFPAPVQPFPGKVSAHEFDRVKPISDSGGVNLDWLELDP